MPEATSNPFDREVRLRPSKPTSPSLSRELSRDGNCPACLGELDTGWECDDCGFDAIDYVVPEED